MKKKASAKRKIKAKPKRQYDNSSRAEKSEQTQKSIIETLVKLLVERRGGDVNIDEISKESGISQRSIFRFFKDKKALHQATDNYLATFLQASFEQINERDVVGFAKNTFALFDKYENLVMAYLFSPFGQQTRTQFRKKLNHLVIAQILKEKKISLTKENEPKIAIVVSLINAKIWYDIRTDFGFSGEKIGEAIGWAMEALLKEL